MSKKNLADVLNRPALRKKFDAAMRATFGDDIELPPSDWRVVVCDEPHDCRMVRVPKKARVVVQPAGFRTFNIPDECPMRVAGIAGYLRKHTDLRAVEKAQVDDGLRLALMIGLDQLEAQAKYQAERDADLDDAGIREVS